MTGGNKIELVAAAVRRLLDEAARTKPLFGAHPGSVKIRSDVDPTEPVIDPQTDAESGGNSSVTDLLLDTHIALWVDSGDERLGTTSRRMIEAAWDGGGRAARPQGSRPCVQPA